VVYLYPLSNFVQLPDGQWRILTDFRIHVLVPNYQTYTKIVRNGLFILLDLGIENRFVGSWRSNFLVQSTLMDLS
jgi:hypothetical protein